MDARGKINLYIGRTVNVKCVALQRLNLKQQWNAQWYVDKLNKGGIALRKMITYKLYLVYISIYDSENLT